MISPAEKNDIADVGLKDRHDRNVIRDDGYPADVLMHSAKARQVRPGKKNKVSGKHIIFRQLGYFSSFCPGLPYMRRSAAQPAVPLPASRRRGCALLSRTAQESRSLRIVTVLTPKVLRQCGGRRGFIPLLNTP